MRDSPLSTLSGWGRHSARGRERVGENIERISADVSLSRGLGRSYGDASLPAEGFPDVLNTRYADRILAFDEATGGIRTESGCALSELNRVFMPHGWFTPVSPGTKFVTVGGMVGRAVWRSLGL